MQACSIAPPGVALLSAGKDTVAWLQQCREPVGAADPAAGDGEISAKSSVTRPHVERRLVRGDDRVAGCGGLLTGALPRLQWAEPYARRTLPT